MVELQLSVRHGTTTLNGRNCSEQLDGLHSKHVPPQNCTPIIWQMQASVNPQGSCVQRSWDGVQRSWDGVERSWDGDSGLEEGIMSKSMLNNVESVTCLCPICVPYVSHTCLLYGENSYDATSFRIAAARRRTSQPHT